MSQSIQVPTIMNGTHADRPRAKRILPIVVIPYLVNGRAGQALTYKVPVPVNGITYQTEHTVAIEQPQDGLFADPSGVFCFHVQSIMQAFWEEESRVDGLLASIDTLTTDHVLLQRENEKLANQLAQAKSEVERLNAKGKEVRRKGEM